MALSDYVIILGDSQASIPVQLISITPESILPGENEMQALQRVAQEVGGVVMENNEKTFWAPREYRSAWRFNQKTKKIEVDLSSLKKSLLIRIRKRRDIKILQLDIPFMRALEDGDTEKLQEIKAQKTMLRDLPVIVEQRMDSIIGDSKLKDKLKLFELENLQTPELDD